MNNSDTVASKQQETQQQQQQAPLDSRQAAGAYRPEQPAGSCSFTTTDASGYPDRQDGLSAYSPPGQDPNEHHKHHQVPCPSSNENSSNNKDQLVNRPATEVADRLGLGEMYLPDQTSVAHFLR
ncbi:hypothetical protein EC957_003676 [Mortierella hygrophila]|uniref:Uncharacterized protein n=1 Tax=Mortierella hygrophila TaxID=979708 RepID=A0A9P6K0B1_9FUNG|nr:hypothetical protein EC957_003676 [Mortierella hygrophila]